MELSIELSLRGGLYKGPKRSVRRDMIKKNEGFNI